MPISLKEHLQKLENLQRERDEAALSEDVIKKICEKIDGAISRSTTNSASVRFRGYPLSFSENISDEEYELSGHLKSDKLINHVMEIYKNCGWEIEFNIGLGNHYCYLSKPSTPEPEAEHLGILANLLRKIGNAY